MKSLNTLRTLVDSVIFDNKEVIKQNEMTVAEYFINEAEATDWNWFMEDDKLDNYTDQDILEVKEFLKDYDYTL